MTAPFNTWFGNQRVIAIPVSPQGLGAASLTAVAVVDLQTLTLSAANTTNGFVFAYVWTLGLNAKPTAAASSVTVDFVFQFRTAAHVNVGGTIAIIGGGASSGVAGQPLNIMHFEPCAPTKQRLTIPATSAEVVIQANVTAINGAPNVLAYAA